MRPWWAEARSLLSLDVENEQIDLLYHDTFTGVVLGIGIMAALLAFFWGKVAAAPLMIWSLLASAVYTATLGCCWVYKRSAHSPERRVWWAKCAVLFCLVLGVTNGASSLVIYLPQDVVAESLLHLALAGSALGALVHLSSFCPPCTPTRLACLWW